MKEKRLHTDPEEVRCELQKVATIGINVFQMN